MLPNSMHIGLNAAVTSLTVAQQHHKCNGASTAYCNLGGGNKSIPPLPSINVATQTTDESPVSGIDRCWINGHCPTCHARQLLPDGESPSTAANEATLIDNIDRAWQQQQQATSISSKLPTSACCDSLRLMIADDPCLSPLSLPATSSPSLAMTEVIGDDAYDLSIRGIDRASGGLFPVDLADLSASLLSPGSCDDAIAELMLADECDMIAGDLDMHLPDRVV